MSEEKGITRALDLTPEQWQMVRDTLANGANERDFVPLMEMAKARRLNPLLRQIHFVERWDGVKGRKVWAVQVSIDGLRAIAERTGLYAGQDEPEFVDGPEGPTGLPVACKVKVYRKDWSRPAVGLAYWTEAVQVTRDKATGKERPNAMWGRMPRLMLAKVAEAMAIRKAFPEDTSGLYTGDEIAPAEEVEVTEDKPRETTRKARQLDPSPQRIPDLASVGIEVRSPLPTKVVDVGPEVSDATEPPTDEEVSKLCEDLSRSATVEELGARWVSQKPHRLLMTTEQVDRVKRAFAARSRALNTPPDGTSGPRKGPGPVATAEGSASVSGGTSGAPEASNVVSMDARTYLASKVTRSDLRNAVKRFGKQFGEPWMRLAAQRLVAIDAPANGGLRLTEDGAMDEVRRWRDEPPKSANARKAGAR